MNTWCFKMGNELHFRKLVCAVAVLDMILNTIATLSCIFWECFILYFVISNGPIQFYSTIVIRILVLQLVLFVAKGCLSYYTLKACIRLISTTVRLCQCHGLEDKVSTAKRWRNRNIMNIVCMGLIFSIVALKFGDDVPGFCYPLMAVYFFLNSFITLVSFIHFLKVSNESSDRTYLVNEEEPEDVETLSQKKYAYRKITCVFTFLETFFNGVLILMFCIVLFLWLCWEIGWQDDSIGDLYREIIDSHLQEIKEHYQQLINRSFTSRITVMAFISIAFSIFLLLVKPLISLVLSVKAMAITIHICPMVSIASSYERTSQFRDWNCLLLVLRVVIFAILLAMGSVLNTLATVLLVFEIVFMLGLNIVTWLHVSEIKKRAQSPQQQSHFVLYP